MQQLYGPFCSGTDGESESNIPGQRRRSVRSSREREREGGREGERERGGMRDRGVLMEERGRRWWLGPIRGVTQTCRRNKKPSLFLLLFFSFFFFSASQISCVHV